jgi:predicted Rossmann fold flavoprotein
MQLDLAILGAGAAGMMAAVAAGERLRGHGRSIAIFERNSQPGIKVLVCGGGRCNFTNAGSIEFLIEQFGRNGRFLTPALRHLDNDGLRRFFDELGVPSHIEHDGKVYPDSNQARSVVDALVRRMRELDVRILTGPAGTAAEVVRGSPEMPDSAEYPFQLTTADGTSWRARTLLLTVGGMSYQRMGTIGDGYRFAEGLGHTVVTPRPAIVGLLAAEMWGRSIQGLAVRDVEVRIAIEGTLPKLATGKPTPSVNDLLFTHFGLSGPAVLNLSEIVAELLESRPAVKVHVDFARHLSHDQAHAQMRSWQQHYGKKMLRTLLSQHTPDTFISSTSPDRTWSDIPEATNAPSPRDTPLALPSRLVEQFLAMETVPFDQPCATLTSGHIHRLVQRIKRCEFTITGTRGFKEAMVTAGGIKLSEVDPRSGESKIVPNLFLAGEVLDLTGPSGGYNLQLAFSTGHLAGVSIADRLGRSAVV